MKPTLLYHLWGLGVLLAFNLPAQLPTKSGIELLTENDFFFLPQPTDRYYTSGIRIGWRSPSLGKLKLGPWALRQFFPAQAAGLPFSADYGIYLGQHLFTPSNISLPADQKPDFPYAGLLVAHLRQRAIWATGHGEWINEYQLGWLGPIAGGGWVQKIWHQLIQSPVPQGWSEQIINLPVLGLETQYRRAVFGSPSTPWALDLRSGARLNVLYSHLELGPQLRWEPTPQRSFWQARWFGLVRAQGHHLLLARGQAQPHPFQGVVGTALAWQNASWRIELQQSWQTAAFRGGLPHGWGSIAVGAAW